MSYEIISIPAFEKQIKKIVKKYLSLKSKYNTLVESLENDAKIGTQIGNNCYKIRLSIASKGAGKSGGTRVITYIHIQNKRVYLLSIYDKSEKENFSSTELQDLLRWILEL
jgi:mRNA-degrading endonuclease RelE of RelBE toxin-antitoxin system